MTLGGNVMPRRRVRQARREPWQCQCPVVDDTEAEPLVGLMKTHPPSVKRCYDCLSVRPEIDG